MSDFLETWADSALTALGFFWTAFWAFALGYTVSAMIQVLVTRRRMQQTIGGAGPRAVALGTFFGFISSSCSFAALSATRSLFQKGAGLVPSLAFLLASTNLVVELGIVIFIFLSWQFVLGEYVGGLILILVMWLVVSLTLPRSLEERAREHAGRMGEGGGAEPADWRELGRSLQVWRRIARQYFMEWQMVWKDVTFGFAVAGVIAVAVPASFFQRLFVGSGDVGGPAWWQTVLHTLIGPVAAFFTFIGSMGNIPLAAVLFSSGVSFAGVMAFIFSDLVVFPVLRISAGYFGRRMAFYILGVFLVSLVVAAVILHVALDLFDALPDPSAARVTQREPGDHFAVDYTLFLNLLFVTTTALFAWFVVRRPGAHPDHAAEGGHAEGDAAGGEGDAEEHGDHHEHGGGGLSWDDYLLRTLAGVAGAWLAGGVAIAVLGLA